MVKEITGQSIRVEPHALGFGKKMNKPTALQTYNMALEAPKKSTPLSDMQKVRGAGYKPAAIETTRRIAGERSGRKPILSSNARLYLTPIQVSGRASDGDGWGHGSIDRPKELKQGIDIMKANTLRSMMVK